MLLGGTQRTHDPWRASESANSLAEIRYGGFGVAISCVYVGGSRGASPTMGTGINHRKAAYDAIH
jgi:hypothetical protein